MLIWIIYLNFAGNVFFPLGLRLLIQVAARFPRFKVVIRLPFSCVW
jgi:hypothetical protein